MTNIRHLNETINCVDNCIKDHLWGLWFNKRSRTEITAIRKCNQVKVLQPNSYETMFVKYETINYRMLQSNL